MASHADAMRRKKKLSALELYNLRHNKNALNLRKYAWWNQVPDEFVAKYASKAFKALRKKRRMSKKREEAFLVNYIKRRYRRDADSASALKRRAAAKKKRENASYAFQYAKRIFKYENPYDEKPRNDFSVSWLISDAARRLRRRQRRLHVS